MTSSPVRLFYPRNIAGPLFRGLYEEQRKHPVGSDEWIEYQGRIDAAWNEVRDDPPSLSGLP